MFAGYQNIHQNVTPKFNADFRRDLDLAAKVAELETSKAELEKIKQNTKDLEKLYAEASRL